ncbi:hypothetical protein [Microbispora hainanensis]|uniref:hypothetical protein n=1 Tax=Microbispora hainanensis TaxID=568844 RepID=UPI00386C9AF4
MSSEVLRVHERARHDLWIHTYVDGVPFEQDGRRDGEHVRHGMDRRMRAEPADRGLPHVVVSGPPEERPATAVRAVDDLLAAGREFARRCELVLYRNTYRSVLHMNIGHGPNTLLGSCV